MAKSRGHCSLRPITAAKGTQLWVSLPVPIRCNQPNACLVAAINPAGNFQIPVHDRSDSALKYLSYFVVLIFSIDTLLTFT